MTELQDEPRLKGAQRPRTAARVAAVQALFQIDQNGDRPENVIEQFLVHRFGTTLDGASYEDGCIPEADTQLFSHIVRLVTSMRTQVTQEVEKTLPETWPIARLDPVLRALLLAAAAEATEGDAPAPVLINEYMDVAHAFFSGDEPRLVNGVLDTLFKRLAAERNHDTEQTQQPD
ncbi:transcription antitermination factor NusB [Acetobacter pasteurianus]|uniref:Transcription antitermination protein NusB n=5 Tax=Acetobacter TaxID=434 RepID=C7JHE4_ACEP3|nr:MULTISPECIES: transcription antitermination factor NusB [Acetobacter]NLG91919.1 transcription antitermination factor NusB [Acetobacter sp.]BAU38310.1 transcription antitermination factor NusB [Acetobacter pasteurianus NBRC 101655]GBR55533.1 transcription antitermination factor NusB [Acetobacter senegalensis DSM 18889]AKR49241.1 nitrogen utilization protein B [Acetobacter pasteurianus]ASC07107.1 N utilization substance protein B like protein [Acetobacter pasteurianus subsp. pasteurianus]